LQLKIYQSIHWYICIYIVFTFEGKWSTYVWMYDRSCIFYFLAYEWFWSHRIWQNIFVILQDLVNALYVPKFWGDSINKNQCYSSVTCRVSTLYRKYVFICFICTVAFTVLYVVVIAVKGSCDVTLFPCKTNIVLCIHRKRLMCVSETEEYLIQWY
jgi:hypothetical protein